MGGGLGLKKDLLPKEDFLKLFNVNFLVQSEINNLLIRIHSIKYYKYNSLKKRLCHNEDYNR